MEQEAEEVEEIRAPNLSVPGESEQPADDLPFFCGCKSYEFASAQTLLSHMIRAHGLSLRPAWIMLMARATTSI